MQIFKPTFTRVVPFLHVVVAPQGIDRHQSFHFVQKSTHAVTGLASGRWCQRPGCTAAVAAGFVEMHDKSFDSFERFAGMRVFNFFFKGLVIELFFGGHGRRILGDLGGGGGWGGGTGGGWWCKIRHFQFPVRPQSVVP